MKRNPATVVFHNQYKDLLDQNGDENKIDQNGQNHDPACGDQIKSADLPVFIAEDFYHRDGMSVPFQNDLGKQINNKDKQNDCENIK